VLNVKERSRLDSDTSDQTIRALELEVEATPRDAGPRIRLGQALYEADRAEEAAAHLQLGARLEPTQPDVALLASVVLAEVGREREAAILLSCHVHEQRTFLTLAQSELNLLETFFHHDDAYVRCHSAKAAGRIGAVQTIPSLERLRADSDAAVRMAAEASLKRLQSH
jgi:HEAT repeat protein